MLCRGIPGYLFSAYKAFSSLTIRPTQQHCISSLCASKGLPLQAWDAALLPVVSRGDPTGKPLKILWRALHHQVATRQHAAQSYVGPSLLSTGNEAGLAPQARSALLQFKVYRQVLSANARAACKQQGRAFCSAVAAGAAHAQQAKAAATRAWPAIAEGLTPGTRRALAAWLGVCTAWVGSLVVLGGLTRLTRSGLSMTDWKFAGEMPPRSQEDWRAEFAKYQRSPEFRAVNRGMQLEDFKFIYWMEWAHRMWGRALGLVFIVPAAWFVARGSVRGPLGGRLALLCSMGGAQGLVGWWMVRSGLQEPESRHTTPRVSPYRLASHLASAFTIYGLLLWTTLTLALPHSLPIPSAASTPGMAALRRHALPLTGLIALTAASGAFVAGNDAGHAYNTFPLMNGQWVPDEYRTHPGWANAFESTAAVQLHHRCLALSTLAATGAVWLTHRSSPLPRPARLLLHALAGMAGLQVALGISALLSYVPPSLGAAHQAGALTLLSIALGLLHTLHRGLPGSHTALGSTRAVRPGLVAAAGVLGLAAYVSWT